MNDSPEDFDFNDWFADANMPEESADIFTRANLLSELSDLERRIKLDDSVRSTEPSLGENNTFLEDEYVELAKQFKASRVTVYVRAVPGTKRKKILIDHSKAKEADEEFIFRMLAASIVGMKKADGERKPAKLTQAQVRDLYHRIGDAQINVISDAQRTAANQLREVSADFLPGRSGQGDGQK